MRITDLPFLHFFGRSGARRDSVLFSPMETEETSAGSFFAPLQHDRTMFPAYRFHFSVYQGDGTFIEDTGSKKVLFTGVAAAARAKQRDQLILFFGVPGPELWEWFPHFFPPLPRLLQHEDEIFIPILQRVPRRPSLTYGGRYIHSDFGCSFAELEPAAGKVLDKLLMHFGISMIGCDPHTQYKPGQYVSDRK